MSIIRRITSNPMSTVTKVDLNIVVQSKTQFNTAWYLGGFLKLGMHPIYLLFRQLLSQMLISTDIQYLHSADIRYFILLQPIPNIPMFYRYSKCKISIFYHLPISNILCLPISDIYIGWMPSNTDIWKKKQLIHRRYAISSLEVHAISYSTLCLFRN